MALSMIGLISRKGAVAGCSNWIYRKAAADAGGSLNNILGGRKSAAGGYLNNILGGCCGGGARFSTACVSEDDSVGNYRSSLPPSKISPLLMLPPAIEGGDMVYKFYSLGENKEVSLNKRRSEESEQDLPDDDAKLVGSSHGWLALLNKRNSSLFLSNPLNRRHIKLPPIETLPLPECNLTGGSGVDKLIISCSPDEEEEGENCRAMLTYAPVERLAFCCPGRSTKWTPIGAPFDKDGESPRGYESFVYSRRRNLFFCVTHLGELEAWDLRDPQSPRLIPMVVSADRKNYPWAACTDKELDLKMWCVPLQFLVVAEQTDEVFLVRRFVLERIGPDGSHVEDVYYGPERGYDDSVPYKTIGFDVHKYDPEERALKYMDSCLDGLALFIGSNHGFAVSASEFPGLNPNSIYYTDLNMLISWDCDITYGGHDLGIFDYENRTFSPCYYPCDVQSITRIVPPPMWFTPSTSTPFSNSD